MPTEHVCTGLSGSQSRRGHIEAFRCLQGVQQGSPLSPLLFGLMIDVLDKVMRNLKGSHAPQLKSEDV